MINLIFKAPLRGIAGYGIVSRNIILELSEYKDISIYVKLIPWLNKTYGGDSRNWPVIYNLISSNPKFDQDSNLLHISIAKEFRGRENKYAFAFGYSFFETTTLPSDWVKGCNSMDVMIVPSSFNYETFKYAGVRVPVEIVPFGVDTNFYKPDSVTFGTIPEKFTFLSIAQISPRKGCDLIVKAFLECFRANKDVQLLLRWYFSHDKNDYLRVKKFIWNLRKEINMEHGGNILLIPTIHETQMPRLYASAHALVAPFRGEGWGLPVIESLACGIPVICTNWGGITEFVNKDFGILLDYKLGKVAPNAVMDTSENHFWAEPNYEQLKSAMIEVYNNYIVYKAKAVAAREFLIQNFQWKHSAEKLIDVFKKWQ